MIDSIDRLGVDPRRLEIGLELAERTLAAVVGGFAVAGVDHDELGAGIHDYRAVCIEERARVHVGRCQHRLDVFLLHVGDQGVRERLAVDAVGHHADLMGSDLVAIDPGILLFGRRGGGNRWRDRDRCDEAAAAPASKERRDRLSMAFSQKARRFPSGAGSYTRQDNTKQGAVLRHRAPSRLASPRGATAG